MPDREEFRVTLSLAQMAAILEHETLTSAEIMTNRIYGSLRLVGGIVELAGAGVLCAVPEPTMVTKVACIAVGVHASDQLSAGTSQLVFGRETESFAFKAGVSVAELVGASHEAGQVIGLATEFAVPISTASIYNAFRVSSIRAGRMTVVVSEKPLHAPRKSIGRHTLRDHVHKDITGLQKRLKRVRSANIMSTFADLKTAEWAVSEALRRSKYKVAIYSKLKLLQTKERLTLTVDLGEEIGWGIARAAPDMPVQMKKVVVVIEYAEYNYMPAYIVTAYPVP